MKVFIATVGRFSERQIVGVYSDHDAAEAACSWHRYWTVQPHTVDGVTVTPGSRPWYVVIRKDGSIEDVSPCTNLDMARHRFIDACGTSLVYTCWAVDSELAVQIVRAIVTRLLEQNLWEPGSHIA